MALRGARGGAARRRGGGDQRLDHQQRHPCGLRHQARTTRSGSISTSTSGLFLIEDGTEGVECGAAVRARSRAHAECPLGGERRCPGSSPGPATAATRSRRAFCWSWSSPCLPPRASARSCFEARSRQRLRPGRTRRRPHHRRSRQRPPGRPRWPRHPDRRSRQRRPRPPGEPSAPDRVRTGVATAISAVPAPTRSEPATSPAICGSPAAPAATPSAAIVSTRGRAAVPEPRDRPSGRVERVDRPGVLGGDDRALHLQGRGQLAALLGEVRRGGSRSSSPARPGRTSR